MNEIRVDERGQKWIRMDESGVWWTRYYDPPAYLVWSPVAKRFVEPFGAAQEGRE